MITLTKAIQQVKSSGDAFTKAIQQVKSSGDYTKAIQQVKSSGDYIDQGYTASQD